MCIVGPTAAKKLQGRECSEVVSLQQTRHSINLFTQRLRFRLTSVTEYLAGSRGSLRPDAGKLDHLGPLLGLVAKELAKIGGRARIHRTATLSETQP